MNSTNYCMSVYHTGNSVYRCAYMSHEWLYESLYHFDRIARLWNAIIIQPYLAISLSFQHVQTRANMFPAYARCPNSLPFRFRHQLVIWCNDVDIVNLYISICFCMLLWLSILYMVPVGCKRYTHQGRCHGFVRLETSHTLVPWGEARAKSDRTGQGTGLSLKTEVGGPNNVGKSTITSMTGNVNHTT